MLFSIVTVSLNSQDTLADTLRSVAGQSFVDYEHVIIDGASSDGTLSIIEQHCHDRLRWSSKPDKGLYDAMNIGLREARGDYVLFLNSDDFFCTSTALAVVAAKIAETEPDCVFADVEFVREDGLTSAGRVYSARHFRPFLLRFGIMPPHPAMFVKRSVLEQLGGFDDRFKIAGDFDLIARALLLGGKSFVNLPITITSFRVGGVSTSGFKSKMVIGREMAVSLKALGQPLACLAVQCRFLLKLSQLRLK